MASSRGNRYEGRDYPEYPDTARPFFTRSLECIAALASEAIGAFQFQGRLERFQLEDSVL